jgi:hypothetical protein
MKTTGKRPKTFRLNSKVRRWLQVEEPEDADDSCEDYFDRWLEQKENGKGVVEVGSILVDQSVLIARFDCVPERCAPARGRRRRSCCADVYVPLTVAEKRRLAGVRNELAAHLSRREPRLKCAEGRFYLDEEGETLCRPGGRCVFSLLDGRGRIRCHLHGFAKKHKLSQSDIQPYTCRIFPLLLISLEHGKILLTVLDKSNYKSWNTYSPQRFPCLADPSLPPLVQSMAKTLDWLFGKGFARELSRFRGRDEGVKRERGCGDGRS